MAGYGMKGHVGIGVQDDFGTADVASLSYIPIIDESIVHTLETIQEESMYGRFAQSPTHRGTSIVEGDLSMEAHPIAMGSLLHAWAGSESNTEMTSHWAHSFKANTNDFSSRSAGYPFTVEVFRDVGSAFLYSDMCLDSLEVGVTNGELMNVGGSFIGAGYTRTANTSPTFPAGAPFKWDMASCSYDDAAVVDLTELTLTANKNLEALYTLTASNSPYKIMRSDNETVELSGTFIFQSHSYMLDYESFTEKRFFAYFQGVGSDSLLIDVPSMKFLTFEPTMAGDGIVEASFTAQGLFNTGSGTALEITLTNSQVNPYS